MRESTETARVRVGFGEARGACWLRDLAELTKARLTLMVLITSWVGYCLGSSEGIDAARCVHALIGIALAAAGAAVLNQYLERDWDALMRRTATRPLAAGRVRARDVLWFGLVCACGGVLHLLLHVGDLAAALGAGVLILYLGVYTPMKRRSEWNTVLGAIPGGLPPAIGWVAASGRWDAGASILFALMFFWQLAHFPAIAWIYRGEYARAGFRMVGRGDEAGRVTGGLSLLASGAVGLAGLSLYGTGLVTWVYLVPALALGGGFLVVATRFWRSGGEQAARMQFGYSLLYLPLLLLCAMVLRAG